jgi:hypothetical protein
MVSDQLKRKLKDLKQVEIAIRFKHSGMREGTRLVWNEFFSVKSKPRRAATAPSVRYPLDELLKMDHEQLKQVFADYFCFVYFQYYKENGLTLENGYNPQLLSLMGLPPTAGSDDIKKRFRELAKKYHPDVGGDSRLFIELVDVYNQLIERQA